MIHWKIVILFQILIAIILALFAGFFYFTIGNAFGILLGTLFLVIAIFIQLRVGLSTYDRDIGILTELKDYEGKLELIRNDLNKIPKFIETNNSKIADFIKSNNSDIFRYIDGKILELIQFIEKQNKK